MQGALVRGHQFDPWSGQIPHALEQLSLGPQLLRLLSGARELQLLKPEHSGAGAPLREVPTMRSLHAHHTRE